LITFYLLTNKTVALPLENLHRVPDSVPDEVAVFTEPLAAALEIQEQVQIHPSDHVLLIGAGRLGQLAARTLALTGCELVTLVRRETHKQLLADCNIRTISVGEVGEKIRFGDRYQRLARRFCHGKARGTIARHYSAQKHL